MSRSASVFWFALLLLVLLAQLSIRIDAPWRYIHDDNGMHYSMFGYNHTVAGPGATAFHNTYRDKESREIVGRYLNHPPLLGLSVGAAFWLTGQSTYATARLTAVVFHLVTLGAVCWLAWRLFDRNPLAPVLAAGFFALMPISTYFGKTPVYEPFSTALSLLGVISHYLALERWRRGGSGLPWLLAGLPLWFLAINADWDAHVYLAGLGAITLYGAFRPDGTPRRISIALCVYVAALSALGIALTVGHIVWVGGGDVLGKIAHSATVKTGERAAEAYGWAFWVLNPIGAVDQMRRYFTLGPMVLAGMWLWGCVAHWRRRPLDWNQRWIFAFFLVIAFFLVLVSDGINRHAYFAYPGIPFVVLAGVGVLLAWLPRLGSAWRRRHWVPVTVAGVLVALSLAGAAEMLRFRYAKPSGYVQRRVEGWRERYLAPPGQPAPADKAAPTAQPEAER